MVYFVELFIARIADVGVVVFKRIYQTTFSFQARNTVRLDWFPVWFQDLVGIYTKDDLMLSCLLFLLYFLNEVGDELTAGAWI